MREREPAKGGFRRLLVDGWSWPYFCSDKSPVAVTIVVITDDDYEKDKVRLRLKLAAAAANITLMQRQLQRTIAGANLRGLLAELLKHTYQT